jgi:S-adenosylmethionine hydrolase
MIAIFTDFGVRGPYLGQMKAVLHDQAPGVPVVDLFPDLPPFDVQSAAYLLPAYSQTLSDQAVCLCVVDPGVGTERRALAVHADRRWYIGPDNGLLSIVARRAEHVRVHEVTWRPETLSASFHGRDLFAPVAARVARGDALSGWTAESAVVAEPDWPEDLAAIAYIDCYGNAISGLRAAAVPRHSVVEVAGCRCRHQRVFGEAPPGTPFWYGNSNGLVEIAVAGGSVAARLGLGVGTPLLVGDRSSPADS